MYARCVTMRLKNNTVSDFNRTIENDVLPLLRKQQGFQDEIVLVANNGAEAMAISLWDTKDNAETYHQNTFPEVQRIVSKVIDGTPQVQTYNVPYTTLRKTTARGGGTA